MTLVSILAPRSGAAARRRAFLLVAAAGCGALAVAQEPPDSATPINRRCPVMPDELVVPEFTAVYQERLIGFCCERCLAKFTANPDRFAPQLVAVLGPEPEPLAEGGNGAAAEPPAGQPGGSVLPPGPARDRGPSGAAGEAFAPRLIAWLGKFHPATVHFPIAMLTGTVLAEILLIATRRRFFADAGRFCLWIAAPGAALAAVLGWFFGGWALTADTGVLALHRWLGTATAVAAVVTLIAGERAARGKPASRSTFRLALLGGAALVGVAAFFGGALVYGLGHYAW